MRHRSQRDQTPRTTRTPSKRRRHQRVTRYRATHAEPARFIDDLECVVPPDLSPSHLSVPAPYAPTIAFHTQGAHRGVRRRLLGAAACGVVAALAMASLQLFTFHTYALLMVSVIAGACALVTITLAMSARKEEEVHHLAATLSRQAPEPHVLEDHSPTDGSL